MIQDMLVLSCRAREELTGKTFLHAALCYHYHTAQDCATREISLHCCWAFVSRTNFSFSVYLSCSLFDLTYNSLEVNNKIKQKVSCRGFILTDTTHCQGFFSRVVFVHHGGKGGKHVQWADGVQLQLTFNAAADSMLIIFSF